MSNRKIIAAIQRLLLKIQSFTQILTRGVVLWLLRGLLLIDRQPRGIRGFVLPTTVLLLLVLSLTVGAITLRTYNRTNQAVGERQQRVIYNAATPAIDRAKAKLEFMFDRDRDPRLPSGIPSQGSLNAMLANDGETRDGVSVGPFTIMGEDGNPTDPYTFPDEEETANGYLASLGITTIDVDDNGKGDRLDLDEDGLADNAWAFRADTNGDGTNDATVAYSVVMMRPLAEDEDDPDPLESASDTAIAARARQLEVRHGPLSINTVENPACSYREGGNEGIGPGRGWFEDPADSSTLFKNFQVDVFVLPDDINGTVSTLEFHQDRQMLQGNKWGAWFRNDLEIFPGPRFNWNGAMHTEGSLIVGNNNFRGFLISSPASCLYNRSSSEVTIANVQENPDEGIPAFQGQFISGRTNNNSYGGTNYFHIHGAKAITESAAYGGNQYTVSDGDATKLQTGSDSVNGDLDVIDYALDPVILTVEDVSQARGVNPPDNPSNYRDDDWIDRQLVKDARLYNQSEEAPYVDDAFRADDRYGPKARIRGKEIPGHIGEPIDGEELNTGNNPLSDDEMTRLLPPATDPDGTEVGLDGYWDRRARNQGMRILVGERLELGNAHGWGGGIDALNGQYRDEVGEEPLMPWETCTANNRDRCHEARQRRALYDNLAAVQAAVFYHASDSNVSEPDYPTACMASTVHPGSAETLVLSSAFKDLSVDIDDFLPNGTSTTGPIYRNNLVVSNFFMGTGTNGWEYEVAPETITDEGNFERALAPTKPLGIALRNLAYFAGDPLGGAPSFEPVDNTVDTHVHPYPWMSMWGDFSVLRRILSMLDGLSADQGNPFPNQTKDYADLSPADKATLHAASCMIGMLAYNIGFLDAFDYNAGPSSDLDALAERLSRLDTNSGNDLGSVDRPFNVRQVRPNEAPEAYIASLKQWNQTDDSQVPPKMVALAEMIMLKEQVSRDRRLGFEDGLSSNAAGTAGATFNLNAPAYENLRKLTTDKPKFPALRYVFPGDMYSASGTNPDGTIDDNDVFSEKLLNPLGPDYLDKVRDRYIRNTLNNINGNLVKYRGIDLADPTVLKQIAVYPKPLNDWDLPHQDAGTGNTTLSNLPNGVMIGCLDNSCSRSPGADVFKLEEVGFKDTSIFNGRELLPSRSMDVNIDLIRQSTTGLTSDSWLPNSGIIYAFREDAVREDEITRPTRIPGTTTGAWNTCGRDAVFSDPSEEPDCYMQAIDDAFDSTDPPLNDQNRISAKPVDYYPDPDRRPHGFRIRNGQKVWRATDVDADGNLLGRGLSFITDNPVYIMGDFNLHQDATCNGQENCRLEEFTQKLNDTFSNFYSRTTLDSEFARPTTDQWRPSEILADAITVISDRFCDGSVEDIMDTVGSGGTAQLNGAFVTNLYGCQTNGNRTSYLNNDRIRDRVGRARVLGELGREYWQHVNPYDALFAGTDWQDRLRYNTPITPVVWSRNGNPIKIDHTEYDRRYYELTDSKPLIATATNRINAIIISGLIPSRSNQAYGGLHNFPRFIENWQTLYISGSLLQLNFSRYATAPFSQNVWEAGEPASGSESIRYYRPPNRRWGYDVALQYAPAGPLASRFVSIGNTDRSEFYSEPPADDPYLSQLCHQITDDPDTNCAPLPNP